MIELTAARILGGVIGAAIGIWLGDVIFSWLRGVSRDKLPKVSAVIWLVEWNGRSGDYHSETHPSIRPFDNEKAAIRFRDDLVAAYKLVDYSGYRKPRIRKIEGGSND